MKLASIKNDTRDGALAVVSRDLKRATLAYDVAPTLQAALDDWDYISPQLQNLYDGLNRRDDSNQGGGGAGGGSRVFAFDALQCAAPLPRAYQWLDADAYLSHAELLRRARGAEMPPGVNEDRAKKDPMMVQGNSDYFIGPCDPIHATSEDWGIDLEAEVAVVLGDVPAGIAHDKAGEYVRLFMLANDVSLRNLVPSDPNPSNAARNFGFIHARAATAFSPVAVTPDELGSAWDGRRLQRPVRVFVNEKLLGEPDCGTDMRFDYPHLIAHAARTRPLGAGAVLAAGVISNSGHKAGFACIAEARAHQVIKKQDELTPWLQFGDRVRIDMTDAAGHSIFGAVDQLVVQHPVPRKRGEGGPDAAEEESSAMSGEADIEE